jgi:hypothetical protein
MDQPDHDRNVVIGSSEKLFACWARPYRAEQTVSGSLGTVEQDGQQKPMFDLIGIAELSPGEL